MLAIAAAVSLITAPLMSDSASAVKREKTTCPSGNECQGNSGAKNPNAECTVVAGSNEQTPDKKTCEPS